MWWISQRETCSLKRKWKTNKKLWWAWPLCSALVFITSSLRQTKETARKNHTHTHRDEGRKETFQHLKSFMLKSADDTAGIKPLSLKLGLVNISWNHLSSEVTKLIQWLHWDLRALHWDLRARSFLTYTVYRGPGFCESRWSSVNTRESPSGRSCNAMLVANQSREHTL